MTIGAISAGSTSNRKSRIRTLGSEFEYARIQRCSHGSMGPGADDAPGKGRRVFDRHAMKEKSGMLGFYGLWSQPQRRAGLIRPVTGP
jgi:hypothetical protein